MDMTQPPVAVRRMEPWARRTFVVAAVLVGALFVSLIVRSDGSSYLPVDGWGVDLFELAMAAMTGARFFSRSWRSTSTSMTIFPLVLATACAAWAIGDVAVTVQSFGGASVPTPSVADAFYVCFFPICYLAFMILIRRGNNGSLLATSLDGLLAALAVSALSAAFVFESVLKTTGGGVLSTATTMAYPVGDVLLLALAIGALAVLPKDFQKFFGITAAAMATNLLGDAYNLFQPSSKVGYVANAIVWPVALLLIAVATWNLPEDARRVTSSRVVSTDAVGTERSAGFIIPIVGSMVGVAVLVAATLGEVGKPAMGLAAGTLLVCGLRLVLAVRAAQALTSARFRSLIEHSWDLIVIADADLHVAYITPSSERVLGYPPKDLLGHQLTETAHPDDALEVVERLHGLGGDTGRTTAFETRMRNRAGEWRTIAWTATDLLEDPAVRGYVLNGGDVTEARQATEDLAGARDLALAASKAKSEFLSTMSHEIRTPMNGVIGLTDLLLQTSLDADQHELATGVKVSAENLLVIINDILDFSKIEAGRLDIEEVPFDVTRVADDVGRILAGTATAKGIELLIDVHPDVPNELLGDSVRIQQVLLNLGSNAVKFTSEGEVVVRVALTEDRADRVSLRFEVVDMGIGIAKSDQERLFRPFAQADASTTRKYGGTGLGLAICRQLVELMGGTLGLVSAPGEGSTFWFELSLRRSENAAGRTAGVEPRRLDGRRALVVDDNATNRKILRQQLTSWGVDIVEACDGYAALRLAGAAAASDAFDFAILDLNMPGMDGVELGDVLRSDPTTGGMLLFLLSSSGQILNAAEARSHGFAATLTKPVRPSELFDCLLTNLNEGVSTEVAASASNPATHSEALGMILLVEDNKMNQLVGSKVLEKLGYEFDIANHGGEAVNAIQTRIYDAVLMDCQMPEMDGYEATAAIRRLEGATRHTPVIAMTAAAMDGDREDCLAAGMDDYITKPIRLEAVGEVLHRWVRAASPKVEVSEAPDDDSSELPLDPSQIALLRSLDDGDGALLTELISQYLAQTNEGRGELARVVQVGDHGAVERAAHALRGASANIGAAGLAALCETMEQRAKADQLDDAGELVERFDAEFERVSEALNELMAASH
jgi:PAS domain S-box-containing protein